VHLGSRLMFMFVTFDERASEKCSRREIVTPVFEFGQESFARKHAPGVAWRRESTFLTIVATVTYTNSL
jgi:hypothetical protein